LIACSFVFNETPALPTSRDGADWNIFERFFA